MYSNAFDTKGKNRLYFICKVYHFQRRLQMIQQARIASTDGRCRVPMVVYYLGF